MRNYKILNFLTMIPTKPNVFNFLKNNSKIFKNNLAIFQKIEYSGVCVIASRILREICLLISELVIRETELKLNARLGTGITC